MSCRTYIFWVDFICTQLQNVRVRFHLPSGTMRIGNQIIPVRSHMFFRYTIFFIKIWLAFNLAQATISLCTLKKTIVSTTPKLVILFTLYLQQSMKLSTPVCVILRLYATWQHLLTFKTRLFNYMIRALHQGRFEVSLIDVITYYCVKL